MPDGYTAKVLIAWGDPVSDGPAFKPDASNSAADQAQQWGMHNDGLVYFPIDGSPHGLLVQNNEYTDDVLLFPDGTANWNEEKTDKSLNAHGVSVIEIAQAQGTRGRDDDGADGARRRQSASGASCGRRATPAASPARRRSDRRARPPAIDAARRPAPTRPARRCSARSTTAPWASRRGAPTWRARRTSTATSARPAPQTPLERRYGINAAGAGYLWHTTDRRFHADEEPNEPNRFGWVVEIDPFDPTSTPVKRTALGRLKHEGAWVQEARDGRVVVYMGDDEQFEYIYRYVSNLPGARRAGRGSTRSTTAPCTSRSSTPTAPVSGCRSRRTIPRWPAGR